MEWLNGPVGFLYSCYFGVAFWYGKDVRTGRDGMGWDGKEQEQEHKYPLVVGCVMFWTGHEC